MFTALERLTDYEVVMESAQFKELLLQSLEHEKGGVLIYETALQCAINPDLQTEWQKYLDETRSHVRILTQVFADLELDPYEDTPGRQIVRYVGASLVHAMHMALTTSTREAAQLVACECVVTAETKDHMNWELIGKCVAKLKGKEKASVQDAYDQVEDQEDHHLYHSKGWCRELWIDSLGLKAILPPPEEQRDVDTALEAAEAEASAPTIR